MSGLAHTKGRVRPPRVHITYDVETNGAMEKKELPFLVGVLADLSGEPNPIPFKNRKVVEIDRDNFDKVLAGATPRVAMTVENKLTDDNTKLRVELNFKEFADFDPAKIAEQVPALKKLLEMRFELNQLLTKMDGNDKLDQLLADILSNTDKAKALAAHLGLGESDSSAPVQNEGEK